MSVSRRAVITTASIVVGVALVVVLLVVVLTNAGNDPAAQPTNSGTATYSDAPTSRASATPGAGSATIEPTEKPAAGTQSVPGSTPSATAEPGTSSGLAQEPVDLGTPAKLTSQVGVSLDGVASVSGKGDGVGEVSGPSVRFNVSIDNSSSKTLDLTSTVVNVTYGSDDTPSNELVSQRKGFPNSIAAGKTATATYTFPVPTKEQGDVRITVDYGTSVPAVVFQGEAAK
ncbi:hypothetical protein VH571_01075 [Frondihabitans sp. 4ASC-45]|uniref:hypothetical protein n=1 Tax=Frondihabitans sp. 4ASC-45 TaxID=3111636 RepID=UPI003C1B528F